MNAGIPIDLPSSTYHSSQSNQIPQPQPQSREMMLPPIYPKGGQAPGVQPSGQTYVPPLSSSSKSSAKGTPKEPAAAGVLKLRAVGDGHPKKVSPSMRISIVVGRL